MRRGTTPTHTFKSPVDFTTVDVIYVTYSQDGRKIIEKSKEDIEITEDTLTVTLSQTDTLAFSTIGEVEIQVRAKFPDGSALASNVIKTQACKILKEGVI